MWINCFPLEKLHSGPSWKTIETQTQQRESYAH
jgi:hypothetical protein